VCWCRLLTGSTSQGPLSPFVCSFCPPVFPAFIQVVPYCRAWKYVYVARPSLSLFFSAVLRDKCERINLVHNRLSISGHLGLIWVGTADPELTLPDSPGVGSGSHAGLERMNPAGVKAVDAIPPCYYRCQLRRENAYCSLRSFRICFPAIKSPPLRSDRQGSPYPRADLYVAKYGHALLAH